jgi:NIMA (never in mitosis gene a)-related kinase
MKKIKNSSTNEKDIRNTLNEIRILASISSPYIIGFKDAFYDESSSSLLLITEFAEGGDLSKFIKGYQRKK